MGNDKEGVVQVKRAGNKSKEPTGRNSNMVKIKGKSKQIDPLNPDVVLESNQEQSEYITDTDQTVTLSVSGAHYVFME